MTSGKYKMLRNMFILLSHSDLLHLYAHVKLLGQHLDEFAEVHAGIGGVVEDGLRVVALVLHIVHLHVQAQVGHYAARAYQGVVLLAHRGVPALDVGILGAAEAPAAAKNISVLYLKALLPTAELKKFTASLLTPTNKSIKASRSSIATRMI